VSSHGRPSRQQTCRVFSVVRFDTPRHAQQDIIGADGETSYCGIPFMSTRA